MKKIKETENDHFSKKLCCMLEDQYENMPLKSVLYAESRDKFEMASGEKADSGGSEKEKDGNVGSYVKLYKAYTQAMNGDAESIRGYLKMVFEMLDRKDESKKEKQLWIPSNKESVKKRKDFYTDEWRPMLTAFIAEEYLPEADDNITRQWIQKVFITAKEHVEIGRDKKLESGTITDIQNNLKIGFILNDVESNKDSLKGNSRIKKSLLNKCVEDDYFAGLFSSDKEKTVEEDPSEDNFAMFFRIMENGMNEKKAGSEQYRYLLIPLYVDSVTGVSMCIVGRNYFYEKKSFLPCILQVMRLSDVGQRLDNGMSAIFEPVYNYDNTKVLEPLHTVYRRGTVSSAVRKKVCENYFEHVCARYNVAVRDARLLLREIDIDGLKGYFSEGELPEELLQSPFYTELFRSLEKIKETKNTLRDIKA